MALTIELTVLISVVCGIGGFFISSKNARRNYKADVARDAADMTTVMVKLEAVSTTLAEIKADMRTDRDDVRENRERIAVAESELKSIWTHIHRLMGKDGRVMV